MTISKFIKQQNTLQVYGQRVKGQSKAACTGLNTFTCHLLATLCWGPTEALCWVKGGHADPLVTIVIPLGKGRWWTHTQQPLLGLLQLPRLTVVLVEELDGSNGVHIWVVGLGDET